MIDVNNFKDINDTKGHSCGDFYLKEIGIILKQVFHTNAQIFRFGGDEFSVILSMAPRDSIERYILKLDSMVKTRQEEDSDFPDVAVGYSIFEASVNARDTIDEADINMYKNKKNKGKAQLPYLYHTG